MSNLKFCTVSFNRPSNSYVIRYFDGDNYVDDSFYPVIDQCDDNSYVDIQIFNRLQELIDQGYCVTFYK